MQTARSGSRRFRNVMYALTFRRWMLRPSLFRSKRKLIGMSSRSPFVRQIKLEHLVNDRSRPLRTRMMRAAFYRHHQFLQRLWPDAEVRDRRKVASKLVVRSSHRKWHLRPPDYSYPTGKLLKVDVLSASSK